MPHTYHVATININGITAPTKRNMLTTFILQQSLDIVCLQEVTNSEITQIPGYTAYVNIGTENRGTAIIVKEGFRTSDVTRLQSGRGITIKINDIYYVNIYAPSGTAKKKEREEFFNNQLPILIPITPGEIVLAGDFNCIINPLDTTGTTPYSRTLASFINTSRLQDVWDINIAPRGFTHYTTHAASRLDRIYVTKQLLTHKQTVRKVFVTFTDHLAVILHLSTDSPPITWGRGYWKMNVAIMEDKYFVQSLKIKWNAWKQQRRNYDDVIIWWTRYIKQQLKRFFMHEGAIRRRDKESLENYYYTIIYEVMANETIPERLHNKINVIRNKIMNIRLYNTRPYFFTSPDQQLQNEEHPTLYHIMKIRKRQQSRHISTIRDNNGNLYNTQADIARVFTEEYTQRLTTSNIDTTAINYFTNQIQQSTPPIDNKMLLQSINVEELHNAVINSPTNKSPGIDGVSTDFYRYTWDFIQQDLLEVLNTMYTQGRVAPQQTAGIIVHIPKTTTPTTTSDYRSLTLINTDIKLLARILAKRIKLQLQDQLHEGQHCGIHARSIVDAVAKIRNIITIAELTNEPTYILSLDFKNAFDRVSHQYLIRIMEKQGFSDIFITRLRTLFLETKSAININGHITRYIPISHSIRQGCPLSSILYAIYLDPLLHAIHQALLRNDTTSRKHSTKIVAYADDLTIVLHNQQEATIVQTVLTQFERASGAEINKLKSAIIKIGRNTEDIDMMNISIKPTVKILGINFQATTRGTTENTWTKIINTIKQQSRDVYRRDLTLQQRIQYVNTYLLAKIWYVAQFYTPPVTIIRQLNTTISYFIWKGSIFRVPISTLQKTKHEGGLDLINPMSKCRAMCLLRFMELYYKNEPTTKELIKQCQLIFPSDNPPNRRTKLKDYEYLQWTQNDSAYVKARTSHESITAYKKRIYKTLYETTHDPTVIAPIRVMKYWPQVDWNTIWKNLWQTPVSDQTRSLWYEVVHDLIPTRQRLQAIRLAPSDACVRCKETDTIQHRLTQCGDARTQWRWTQSKIAKILRIDPRHIAPEWLLRPQFKLWPEQKQRAVLWILATFTQFRLQRATTHTTQDYFDFLQRTRWKIQQNPNRQKLIGKYLDVINPL